MFTVPNKTRGVPHTEKRPDRCPHCGSTHVAKKGTRKKKIEIFQLWRCASCKRVFTPAPSALRNKTYPLKVVLDAITTYDLGYTLSPAASRSGCREPAAALRVATAYPDEFLAVQALGFEPGAPIRFGPAIAALRYDAFEAALACKQVEGWAVAYLVIVVLERVRRGAT